MAYPSLQEMGFNTFKRTDFLTWLTSDSSLSSSPVVS